MGDEAPLGARGKFRTSFGPKLHVPPPPYTPAGYEKGNLRTRKTHEMNNMEVAPGYLSINRTARFYPLFGRKRSDLGPKRPVFDMSNARSGEARNQQLF